MRFEKRFIVRLHALAVFAREDVDVRKAAVLDQDQIALELCARLGYLIVRALATTERRKRNGAHAREQPETLTQNHSPALVPHAIRPPACGRKSKPSSLSSPSSFSSLEFCSSGCAGSFLFSFFSAVGGPFLSLMCRMEIGRASCRERV